VVSHMTPLGGRQQTDSRGHPAAAAAADQNSYACRMHSLMPPVREHQQQQAQHTAGGACDWAGECLQKVSFVQQEDVCSAAGEAWVVSLRWCGSPTYRNSSSRPGALPFLGTREFLSCALPVTGTACRVRDSSGSGRLLPAAHAPEQHLGAQQPNLLPSFWLQRHSRWCTCVAPCRRNSAAGSASCWWRVWDSMRTE
jgi:hypothetical protein